MKHALHLKWRSCCCVLSGIGYLNGSGPARPEYAEPLSLQHGASEEVTAGLYQAM